MQHKLSFDISILLGYSRFQSLDIYYKASWNMVHEIKLLLLFAYFQMHLCIYAYKPYKPINSTKIEKRCNLPMFLGSLLIIKIAIIFLHLFPFFKGIVESLSSKCILKGPLLVEPLPHTRNPILQN